MLSIRTSVKIRIFPIPIAYWSGFGIFKQKRENPDDIGMVWQSALPIHKIVMYSVELRRGIQEGISKQTKTRNFASVHAWTSDSFQLRFCI